MPGTNISSRHVLPDMFFGQILSTQRLKIGSISFKKAPTCWRPRPTGDLNCSHLPLFIICSTGIDVLIWKIEEIEAYLKEHDILRIFHVNLRNASE